MPDYILEPLDTDPDEILNEFIDFVQSYYPDWNASEGQLDFIIARFFSIKEAVIADMASRVMRTIYRYFGSTVVSIPPLPAVNAQVPVQFTAIDTLGHTIPSGTYLGISDENGDTQIFTLNTDVVIAAGTPTNNGVATALEEGTFGNGLQGSVEVLDQTGLEWLQSALTLAISSGGQDEEDDDTYMNRLTINLGLMAPRPILAVDFALMARNIAGIWRAVAIDNFIAGNNEKQTVSHNGTGGSGTLTWSGKTTAAIPWNATAVQIQAALDAMANIPDGNFRVTGGPWPAAVTIEFTGAYGQTDQPAITASAASLTPGGSTFTIATTTNGTANTSNAANAVAVTAIDVDGNPINPTLKQQLDDYLQGVRQQNFVVSVMDPAYTNIDVTTAIVKNVNYGVSDVQSRVLSAIQGFLDPATWAIPAWPPDQRGWEYRAVVRMQDIYTIINNVEGVDYASTLQIAMNGGALAGADLNLPGAFPLTRPGTITVTVT